MSDAPALPEGARPDDDHPGWFTHGEFRRGSFAAATGRMIFRPLGDGSGQVRMFPTEAHLNLGGSIHGGAVMSFVDMALFMGGRCAGVPRGHYVTLDCSTHFIAKAVPSVPLDAFVRLVGQTKGGLMFLSGHCAQGELTTHSFTGTLKKIREPNGPA
ncbi:MAG: hypothetical protein NVS3B5_12000 [Sphingomicrobium sp.]